MTTPLHAIVPYGRGAPSARVRVHDWLRIGGVSAIVHDYLGESSAHVAHVARHPMATIRAERDLRSLAQSSPPLLLLHRECSPMSDGTLESRLLSEAGRGTYDLDDALQWDTGFVGYGSRLRRFRPKAQKAIRSIQAADQIIVGNESLAEWASAWASNITIIPSCVEPDRYRQKSSYRLSDPPVLGWIGSSSTERYLAGIAPALLRLRDKFGIRLVVMSDNATSLGELEPMVERIAWSETSSESLPATWDIGIMPVPERLFERGKCGYKLLQYGAVGLPAVASPVGVNRRILAQLGMISATTDDEWFGALEEHLTMSPETRMDRGDTSRRAVARLYSYAAWQGTWRQVVLGDAS